MGPIITAAAGSAAGVEGTLRLADGAVVPAGGTLFLIARRPGVERGPPVATRKMLGGRFPTPFTLGSGDVMMGGAFPDQVSLSARLDADGDPMTQGPQDLIGSAGVVSSGDQGVEIVLAPRAD